MRCSCRSRSALRRPLADGDEDPLRDRVRRHDARVRSRHGPRPARLDSRPARAPLAGVRPRARFRDRALALGASGRRAELRPSSRDSPTGCTSSRRSSGSVASSRSRHCVWPLAPALRRTAFLGFSRIATVLVAVLVLAGTYLSISRLPTVSDLWTTSLRTGHCSSRSRSSASRSVGGRCTTSSCGRDSSEVRTPRGLRRSLIGESTLAILVLLVAAVLVNARPPAVEPAGRYARCHYPGSVTLVSISGGAGFLGLHLARRVLADGGDVRTLDVGAARRSRARARGRGGARRHPLGARRARRSCRARTSSSTLRPRCRSSRRARRFARSTSRARRTCSPVRSTPACGASS